MLQAGRDSLVVVRKLLWHAICSIGVGMGLGICIDELDAEYDLPSGRIEALSRINLEVLPGEFLCILGESGCGKSTLLRILAGLQVPTGGSVQVNGTKITGPNSQVGVVFQNPALLPWLTVEKNVGLGFRIRGESSPGPRIRECIDLVGLRGFEAMRPKSLSGGMAQRAAIARALVGNPEVLLMDEPFSSLDAITRSRMQRELQEIWRRRPITIVFVTHDIDEAVVLGTRVVVMTPRPGRVGRILQIPLEYPRSRRAPDFVRLKSMIADELLDLGVNGVAAETPPKEV